MRAEKQLKITFFRASIILLLVFLLSGCTSTFISYPLMDASRIQNYECGTIPKIGNFFDYSLGNSNNILFYSYDNNNKNRVIFYDLDIISIDLKTKKSTNVFTLPIKNKTINELYYELLWMYVDNKTNELILLLNIIEGKQSNIYKVTGKNKILLFSYPKPIYWSRFGLVESTDHTDLDKMYLFFKDKDFYDVFLISLNEKHVFKNLRLPIDLKTLKITSNYIFGIQKGHKEDKVILIEKNTFDYQYISYYPKASFVGSNDKEDIVLVCDHQNCLIEILSPEGIIGTFPAPIYPENLDTILMKKYPTDYSMFIIPKTTSYGHDNQCIWLRYSPTKKYIRKTYFNLPKQLNYYFTDSYESYAHEFIGLGLNHINRESYLVFFYFNSGKVQFEQIQHQNFGYKSKKFALNFWPKERVFTWVERYYESDLREYKNYLFYCNLNRFDTLLSRYKTDPVKNSN